jgi:hypothetical protein
MMDNTYFVFYSPPSLETGLWAVREGSLNDMMEAFIEFGFRGGSVHLGRKSGFQETVLMSTERPGNPYWPDAHIRHV